MLALADWHCIFGRRDLGSPKQNMIIWKPVQTTPPCRELLLFGRSFTSKASYLCSAIRRSRLRSRAALVTCVCMYMHVCVHMSRCARVCMCMCKHVCACVHIICVYDLTGVRAGKLSVRTHDTFHGRPPVRDVMVASPFGSPPPPQKKYTYTYTYAYTYTYTYHTYEPHTQ